MGVLHKTGEVGRLYVAPAAQGQGIGAKLLVFARKKLPEQEHPHLLVLNVNKPARALYTRMGWRPAGVHRYFTGPECTVQPVYEELFQF